MLRLQQKLRPRISNHLAALSAVTLLVSTLAGMSDSMPAREQASDLTISTQNNTVEPGQNALPALQTAKRQGVKISLLILGHH